MNKIILLIFVFIVAGGSLAFFLTYPVFKGIKTNSEQIIQQKMDLAILDAKIKNLEKFDEQNIGSTENLADGLLVDAALPVDFIRFLEKTAKDAGLSIKIAPPTANTVKDDIWPSMSFQLDLSGSFPGFLRFIEKLEKSRYLIAVNNFTVSRIKDDDKSPTGDVKAGILIKVYSK